MTRCACDARDMFGILEFRIRLCGAVKYDSNGNKSVYPRTCAPVVSTLVHVHVQRCMFPALTVSFQG